MSPVRLSRLSKITCARAPVTMVDPMRTRRLLKPFAAAVQALRSPGRAVDRHALVAFPARASDKNSRAVLVGPTVTGPADTTVVSNQTKNRMAEFWWPSRATGIVPARTHPNGIRATTRAPSPRRAARRPRGPRPTRCAPPERRQRTPVFLHPTPPTIRGRDVAERRFGGRTRNGTLIAAANARPGVLPQHNASGGHPIAANQAVDV